MRSTKTPGTPKLRLVHPTHNDDTISNVDQKQYHYGVGMLLYLVKHSHPDFANAVRELSKVLDGAHKAAYKEMHQIIKYVLDTRDLGLKIEPILGSNKPWKLICFSDSNYAGDPDSIRSISGYVLYVC